MTYRALSKLCVLNNPSQLRCMLCSIRSLSNMGGIFRKSCKFHAPIFCNSFKISSRYDHHKAAVLKEFGKALEIKELKTEKKLKDAELRIKVHCCAVNLTDSLLCSGEYDTKPKLPFVPGHELSGEVLDIGTKVKGFSKGDKVIALSKETFSGLSEQCIVASQDVWHMPNDMSFDTAAALVDNYATVLIATRRVNLKEDDDVLVTASAGGLGMTCVDIAANLYKAKVIGACDTEDKASLVRDKGAFAVINYSKKDMSDAIMEVTGKAGVKVVFDAVGGDVFKECLNSVAPEGNIVVLGFASRKIPEIATNQLLPRSCAIIGVSLTHYRKLLPDVYRSTVQEIIDMYDEDFIEPYIVAHFKLGDVNEAFKFIEDKKSTGKVIVNVC